VMTTAPGMSYLVLPCARLSGTSGMASASAISAISAIGAIGAIGTFPRV